MGIGARLVTAVAFPLSYLWQSLRYGYSCNAYEIDARRYSALRLAQNAIDKDL